MYPGNSRSGQVLLAKVDVGGLPAVVRPKQKVTLKVMCRLVRSSVDVQGSSSQQETVLTKYCELKAEPMRHTFLSHRFLVVQIT